MEHLVFHLVYEAIQALDRRLQKPLHKAIPELAQLRSNPRQYLQANAITFGPRKRHALAAVIGLASAAIVVVAILFAFRHMPKPKQPDPWRIVGVGATFLVVALVARAIALRLLPGGRLTLRTEGAELQYRDAVLFLPWDVLHATGSVFEPDHRLAVLPINPKVPVAVSDDEGNVEAVMPEELELPQAEASDDNQLALKDLYEVRIGDVGGLLREIGLALGKGSSMVDDALIVASAPLAVPETDNWLRIHLTQLPFPPVCCACSDPTTEQLELALVAGGNRHLNLALPVCERCQSRRRRRRWIGGGLGVGVGFVVGAILAATLVPARRDPAVSFFAFLVFGSLVAVPLALVAQVIARDLNTPVRHKDYRPDKGTVKIMLRWPERAAGFLEALGLEYRNGPREPVATGSASG